SSLASLSKARPIASSSSASSKLAMPRAKRKHRWASLRIASASRGGSSSSEDRQRVSNREIEEGSASGYLMACHGTRDRSIPHVSNWGKSAGAVTIGGRRIRLGSDDPRRRCFWARFGLDNYRVIIW